uniref:uncharacterized protein LOC122587815 n=1 Tax=Erigeron canadensis TaxID=72917 RepID=UPI001CB911EF|nr:uncharacterized protein LOC122587815 [Erigeron canadensis]
MSGEGKELAVRDQGTVVPFQCLKLTETNYTTWSIMIETVLKAYGHWDAITKDEVDEKKNFTTKERVQKARLQTLRNELERLKMKENESINDFAGKISNIVARFKSLGSTLEDEVVVRKFLNSVPKKKALDLEEDHGQLLLSEQRFGESSGGRGRGRGRNNERGGRGRGRGHGDKSGIRCYDCGVFGHFSYQCTKWKGKNKDEEANLVEDDDEPTLL